MMDDQTTNAGSPVMAEQPTTTQQQPNLTQSIRVTRAKAAQAAAKADQDADEEEAALVREEDRMLEEDEEITSDEEESHAVTDKMERKLVTVALVKSFVETGRPTSAGGSATKPPMVKPNNPHKKRQPQPDVLRSSNAPSRYGLRKRRRGADNDLKRLEQNPSPTNGGLALLNDSGGARPLSSRSRCFQVALPPIIKTASSSVPNPLASAPIHPPPILPTTTITAATSKITTQHRATATTNIATVPCPLPSSLPPEVVDSHVATTAPTATPLPSILGVEMMPPEHSVEKRKVTISEDPIRLRGMSIDLESVGLGFPDDEVEEEVKGGELSLPNSSSQGRERAFSFECFAFGISADEPLPPLGYSSGEALETSSSSERPLQHHDEYSALVGDHDQYPCEESSSAGGRPRGESIIFDPSSFQEGGIHEKSALETARAPSSDIPGLGPGSSKCAGESIRPDDATSSCLSPILQSQPPPTFASSTIGAPKPPGHAGYLPPASTTTLPLAPVTSYTATTTKNDSTNSVTVTTALATGTASSTTMAMELLNKDGRIGIYLPEARKARIARFHAKRARRIWRKRIKYDCRKKLADSRPRIKGRFVKRSEMEEE